MQMRRLLDTGIAHMNAWLDRSASQAERVPDDLLSSEHSEPTDYGDIDAEKLFETRLDWGIYIHEKLAATSVSQVQRDTGIWAWMTLLYFDQVCPRDRRGTRRIAQRARYIPTATDFRTYYRHLLEGPWRLVRAHEDRPARIKALLAGPLQTPGDFYEQFAARQEIAGSRTVAEVAATLYARPDGSGVKRGAGGSGPGSPRRLVQIVQQFELTYDVYGMSSERLIALLPREFDRFRPDQARSGDDPLAQS